MERTEIDVNELKNLLLQFVNTAFNESFDKGKEKYGDRWKTTGWTGIKGLADSKWDMFLNLLDTNGHQEIGHHASDMIAWITILAARAIWDIRHDEKRETVYFTWDEFQLDEFSKARREGKRVVIE